VVTETISLKQLIAFMDEGKQFSIGFRTFDDAKQTGGEWIAFDTCVKSNFKTHQERKAMQKVETLKVHKNPNHYENATRNITVLPDGKLVKVHLRLIRKFNGKTVL
jgi:uncharacterized protein (DUF1015 family)